MKNLRIIYYLSGFMVVFLSIGKSNLSIWLKTIILFFIFSSFVFSEFCFLVDKAFTCRWVEVFLKEMSLNLSYDEFKSIIVNCDQLFYISTTRDIIPYLKQLDEYMADSFSIETRKKVVTIYKNMEKLIENRYEKSPFSISIYLHSRIEILFLRYISFEVFDDKSNSNQNDAYLLLYLLPPLAGSFLFIFKNTFFIILLLILDLAICYIHSKLDRRLWVARICICFDWIILLISLIFFPQLIDGAQFFKWNTFYILAFSQIILILIGLYITNNIWTYTKFEKRDFNKFITPPTKFYQVISIRIISLLRHLWIWFNFLFIIIGIVAFYTFIYYHQFIMGSFEMCLFSSIDIFFNGNIPDIYIKYDDITTIIYFYSESIASYIINILYLANIVRLILEPKVSN